MMKKYNLRPLKIHQEPDGIIKAVVKGNWKIIDRFLIRGGDINASLSSTGPHAGYTALHFAILRGGGQRDQLEKLVKTYGANINSMGADGAQPLHISTLEEYYGISRVLIELGADINTKLTRKVVEKYSVFTKWIWPDEFEEMTLCSLLCVKISVDLSTTSREFMKWALNYGANLELKDKNNKTLLMYVAECGWEKILDLFCGYTECSSEFMNAKNNSGLHAVHYLLPNPKLGVFHKYKPYYRATGLWYLINAGADINAMVDNNPDTLLINIAAEQCEVSMLGSLLQLRYLFPAEGKPLKYLMLPIDPEKLVEDSDDKEEIKQRRNECLEKILEIYTLRREFGLFVPEEEKELMDQLIAKEELKKIVQDFKVNFIDKLKTQFSDGSLTVYDLVGKVFDKRNLKLLVKNEKLVEEFENYFMSDARKCEDKFWLFNEIYFRICKAHKRRNIMEKVEKISHLRKFVPLPYEIILMILEYLDNEELKKFVNSFYDCPICE